ncbi:gliding motility-associated ABC transporter substrate-binding protein GldG [Bacteroidia bacterium]|nr:gliding motility-associated ABC transporter substrate-binding protein GldG [Bacteroidia bacterium]
MQPNFCPLRLLIIALIVLLNIISYFLFIRIDTTSSKRYSLSNASKEVIKKLEKQPDTPVTIDFYLSKELPPEARKIAKEFVSLLQEYRSTCRTQFTINIIHPSDALQKIEAEHAGIIPVIVEIKDIDYEKIQNIYMGAVFHVGSKTSVIPHLDNTIAFEYETTRILKQAIDTVRPKIAFVTGHQEASFPLMPQFINPLSELAELSAINLETFIDLPSSLSDNVPNLPNLNVYDALCIIAPKTNFSSREKEILNKYLDKGGRLFIALQHAVGQINENRNTGFINETGLEDILADKGLKVQNDFVIDNNCGSITVNQYNGFMRFPREIRFPYIVKINNFSDNIITRNLNMLLMPYISSMKQVKTNTTYIYTPLAMTSSISGTQQAPIFFNLTRQWQRDDFNKPQSVVAALLSNDDNNSAIIAVSNADFLINNLGLYSRTLQQDNVNFALNSLEWLADDSGLINLRGKFSTFSSLKAVDKRSKLILQYINFLLPLFIIFIFAGIRLQARKNKRIRRMGNATIT